MKKKLITMLGLTMLVALVTACGSNNAEQTGEATETVETTENTAEMKTYEFETFDGYTVVINGGTIISQKACEEPLEWEGLPADAEQIAPGRDYILFQDAENYYVEDVTNKLVTVAFRELGDVIEDTDIAIFDNDVWSISFDTEKWYGYIDDNGSTIINNLDAVAGSSYIEIKEVDVATADEAIAMIEDELGNKLVAPEKIERSGSECYVTYNEPATSEEQGVAIFDFYLIFEHNGKVIIINESITEDPDASRAEALSYEFDDVVNTFVLK